MPSDSDLPPKSLSALSALATKKRLLRIDLGMYCINDHGCYNKEGAKDYLRSYCCSIFDLLKEEYDRKVVIWDCEEQIAEEAVRHALECWENFNGIYPPGSTWRPTLRDAIIQHLGRPIRQPLQKVFVPPSKPSPLSVWAQAQTPAPVQKQSAPAPPPPQVPALPTLGDELRRLLLEARIRPEDIAEEIGIEPRNVYRHLSGETKPTIANIGKYERALSAHLKRQ